MFLEQRERTRKKRSRAERSTEHCARRQASPYRTLLDGEFLHVQDGVAFKGRPEPIISARQKLHTPHHSARGNGGQRPTWRVPFRWAELVVNLGCLALVNSPVSTGPQRCKLRRRKTKSDDHTHSIIQYARGPPRAVARRSAASRRQKHLARDAGNSVLGFERNSSLDIPSPISRTLNSCSACDNGLLNDDFSCSPTSTTGGSLHVIRSSRPRRTDGFLDVFVTPEFQLVGCWWRASRWKSRSDGSTPSL